MPYRIDITPAAERDLKHLPRQVQTRIAPKIDGLAINPRPHGVEKLSGYKNRYRIREGDYRIIYEVYDKHLAIWIIRVGNRRDVYKRK